MEPPSILAKSSLLDPSQTDMESLNLKNELSSPALDPQTSPKLQFYVHKTDQNDEIKHKQLKSENGIIEVQDISGASYELEQAKMVTMDVPQPVMNRSETVDQHAYQGISFSLSSFILLRK